MSKTKRLFQEDFLQFVWKFQLFETKQLCTNEGESVSILHPGTQNFESGPDFKNARIKINGELWAGNVEVHYDTKEWYQHKHHLDPAYNNVVLHVVYKRETAAVLSENEIAIPSITLSGKIFDDTLSKYKQLQKSDTQFVPCASWLPSQESILFTSYYPALVAERLQRKVADAATDLQYYNGSFDDAILISLFKYFGAPANKEPFEIVARSFALKQLSKQATSIAQMEAMLFGLAGMLSGQDSYAKKLENEFMYISKLHGLEAVVAKSQWQFSGVRPPNFPSIRMAQLAALLFQEQRLFAFFMEESIENIMQGLSVNTSDYWSTHYNFGVKSKPRATQLTKSFIHKLLINVVVPFLFYYGKLQSKEVLVNRSLEILGALKAESNTIVTQWKQLGLPAQSAFDTQALLQLKRNYCEKKRCLDCRIGYGMLKVKKKQ